MPAGCAGIRGGILFDTRRASAGAPVVVVEGYFDCMNVHQAGIPLVVALMESILYDPNAGFYRNDSTASPGHLLV